MDSASVRTVRVDLVDAPYDIQIGRGNLEQIGELVAGLEGASHAIVATDANVEQPHATAVADQLANEGLRVELMVIEAGEKSKSIDVADSLWNSMLEAGADRKTIMVAAGGGVVGDLAGFVAATYMRGIRFVQVPTTLLAQVDSSVGGKVGINVPDAKNVVGAFWQPAGVLIDVATLDTLPSREYSAGLAEVVKYGVILDAEFFAYLESHVEALRARDHGVLTEVVARCCRIKADVVEEDEMETRGVRAILNYGHTFGHAFEALLGYGEMLHGEAVSVGMLCASRLAERLGYIGPEVTQRQLDLLAALELPLEVPAVNIDEVLTAMGHDKKAEHGRLRFILPVRLGRCEVFRDVDEVEVRAALSES